MGDTDNRTRVGDGEIAVDDRSHGADRPRHDPFDDPPQPLRPGFWLTVLGGFVAVLAPLIGFLGGSISGAGNDPTGRQLAIWLLVGLVIGGLGVLCAFIGALRWWRAAEE
ncbi:MAG: hypothetical protein L0H79_05285 [Intrasporangium sp.]|uniref:hypothetical protein n=1 Tax=Intrasporangium sp. TaxID=1925024 RepID=UPI00264A15E6|nr:hypothetical protein [Intrasporangium sp.]MDN5795149.1 hypothetical protein [Intrasporangium sp.]